MAKEKEGATVEVEELELTEPEESQEGAYAEVGEFDETEPTETEGTQELTEPVSEVDEPTATEEPEEAMVEEETVDIPEGKKSADRAFAEMRRANENLSEENAELRERIEALERNSEQDNLIRTATEMGLSDEEIQMVLEDAEAEEQAQRERNEMQGELEGYRERVLELETERRMEDDLRKIQSIDPEVKTLDDLPPEFLNYIAAGLDGEEAFWAVRGKNEREKFEGAKELGKANSAPVERDYYTSEELDGLSDEEMDKNWDKVQRSLKRL